MKTCQYVYPYTMEEWLRGEIYICGKPATHRTNWRIRKIMDVCDEHAEPHDPLIDQPAAEYRTWLWSELADTI